MERVCFMLPIFPGKTEEARRFVAEMGGPRWAEYDRSQRRLGIEEEEWFLTSLPSGDYFIFLMRGHDFARVIALMAQSNDEYDRWFKQQLIDLVGIDLHN